MNPSDAKEAPRPKRRGLWDFVLCTTSASALDCDKGKALDPRKVAPRGEA